MVYAGFLDTLTNVLFNTHEVGVATLLILLCIVIGNIIVIRRFKEDFPEAISTEFPADSSGNRTKRKLVNLLLQMQEEIRILSMKLDNMSPTDKEAAEARIHKIEDRMERLLIMSKYMPD